MEAAPAPALFPLPPKLVDLSWSAGADPGVFVAKATQQFLLLWLPDFKETMRNCGLTLHVHSHGHNVHWTAVKAAGDYQQ